MLALGAFFVILFGVALLQTVLVQGQIHLDGLRADVAERQINQLGMTESDPEYILPPAQDAPATP